MRLKLKIDKYHRVVQQYLGKDGFLLEYRTTKRAHWELMRHCPTLRAALEHYSRPSDWPFAKYTDSQRIIADLLKSTGKGKDEDDTSTHVG